MKPSSNYRFSDFRLDPVRRKLYRDDEEVVLAGKPMELLLTLVEARDRILGREELLETVWPDAIVEEANLTQGISVLRKALGEDPGENRIIATVRGRGYRFVAELDETLEPNESVALDSVSVWRRLAPAWITALGLGFVGLALWYLISAAVVERPHPPPLEKGTIAVLPALKGGMNEPADEEGMELTDAVIAGLVSRGLSVRPTRDVLEFRDPSRDTPGQAGRSLGVEYVVTIAVFDTAQGSHASLQVIWTLDGSVRGTRRLDRHGSSTQLVQAVVDATGEILEAVRDASP